MLSIPICTICADYTCIARGADSTVDLKSTPEASLSILTLNIVFRGVSPSPEAWGCEDGAASETDSFIGAWFALSWLRRSDLQITALVTFETAVILSQRFTHCTLTRLHCDIDLGLKCWNRISESADSSQPKTQAGLASRLDSDHDL